MKAKAEEIPKNLKTKTVLLCEACGGYHPEEDCEIVLVKIIKGKDCNLNMTKDNTYAPPRSSAPAQVVIPESRERVPEAYHQIQEANSVPSGAKDIVPAGIRKNDPRMLKVNVPSAPVGLKIPSVADMMRPPGT